MSVTIPTKGAAFWLLVTLFNMVGFLAADSTPKTIFWGIAVIYSIILFKNRMEKIQDDVKSREH